MNHTAPWSGNPSFPRECARAGGNFRNRSILPTRRRSAGDGLEDIVIGEHHEAAIEQPFLAGEDGFHDSFEVVVDHALGHAAEEGEGLIMRIEDHFLGFPGIGHDEHLSAEGQAEMRELDGLHDAAEFDLLVAPIELADLAGGEGQRDKRLGECRAGFGGFPALHEALHAVIGAAIALGLQPLEQATRGAALGFW